MNSVTLFMLARRKLPRTGNHLLLRDGFGDLDFVGLGRCPAHSGGDLDFVGVSRCPAHGGDLCVGDRHCGGWQVLLGVLLGGRGADWDWDRIGYSDRDSLGGRMSRCPARGGDLCVGDRHCGDWKSLTALLLEGGEAYIW